MTDLENDSVSIESMTWSAAKELTKQAYAKMVMCLSMGGDPTKQEGYKVIEHLFTIDDGRAMRPDIKDAFIRLASKKMES